MFVEIKDTMQTIIDELMYNQDDVEALTDEEVYIRGVRLTFLPSTPEMIVRAGIRLEIRIGEKKIIRRALTNYGEIDLDKLRIKINELSHRLQQYQIKQDETLSFAQKEWEVLKNLRKEIGLPILLRDRLDIWDNAYKLTLHVTEDEVRKVYTYLQNIRNN